MRRLAKGLNGGVAAIFAVLLGSGSLIAVIALGVDFGRVYLEEQSLRNSSSAAALALATACSDGSPVCSSQVLAEGFVQGFLDANSSDGTSGLDELCGSAPLAVCGAVTDNASDCEPYQGSANLVRVTATSKEPGLVGLRLFFTSQDQVELWHCAQAEWQDSQNGTLEFQTSLDLAFPVCDYPGDQTPVVWFQFQNSGNVPGIPRKVSCSVEIDGQTVAAVDYANGMAGIDIAVGNCLTQVSLVSGGIVGLGETNFTKLCNKTFSQFLDGVIAQQLEVPVALLGQFTRHSSNQIDFNIAGTSSIRVLGYVLSKQVGGGQVPPGGWAAYPAGAPKNYECGDKNPCIYGFYSAELVSGSVQNQARLVFK